MQAKHEQIQFRSRVAETKPDADAIQDTVERQRHVELSMGATYQSIASLVEAYNSLLPSLVHDLDIQDGLGVMQRITHDTLKLLKPFANKYDTANKYGHDISEHLMKSLCPASGSERHMAKYRSQYGVLITLTGLNVYLAYIESQLTTLHPVSQALWDPDFQHAVAEARSNIGRMKDWVIHLITVRSPQTLIVPSGPVGEKGAQWMDQSHQH